MKNTSLAEHRTTLEEHPDGSVKIEAYFNEHGYHRTGGPAFIEYHLNGNVKHEIYYKNGKKHREDGYAETEYLSDGTWISQEIHIHHDIPDSKFVFDMMDDFLKLIKST